MKMSGFKMDAEIAYFIGVLHSDGCIYRFNDKKRKRIQIRLNLTIGQKSLPMASEFKRILFKRFGRTVNIRKVPNKISYMVQTSINRLYWLFKQWEDKSIPFIISNDSVLFGSYLAGIIDGDGYVKLKKRDGKTFACQIKISAGYIHYQLLEQIKFHLGCGAHIEKDVNKKGMGYSHCFLISKKNYRYIQHLILPYIKMPYKKERIKEYIKKWAYRDSNPDFGHNQ
jgi:hypothetical protein